jgi:hypothetical protein
MGFRLQLISNSPAIIAAAETSFGRFGSLPTNETADFSFRLYQHALDDGPPDPPVFRLEQHLLYQTTGRDSTLVADLKGGLVLGYFSPTVLQDEPFFRWHFLELAFFMMLEARGLMGVHGAALTKNGKAIMLRARSGGGKTTLAYAAARSRFQALAEDVVWLDRERGLWWGMPWSFHLLPDAKQLFPELAAYAPVLQTNGELKLEVNLETLRPHSTVVSALPGPVVLVERLAGGRSRLEAIDRDILQEAWPEARTGLEMKLPHHQAYIDTLLAEQPAYRLYFGDDIEASLDLLERLFE